MIDLKKILEKHPEAAGDRLQMMGLLQDHYPDYENEYEKRVLLAFIESGIVDELKIKKKNDQAVTDADEKKYLHKIKQQYGVQKEISEPIFKLWIDALELEFDDGEKIEAFDGVRRLTDGLPKPERPDDPQRKKSWFLIFAVITALAIAAAVFFYFRQKNREHIPENISAVTEEVLITDSPVPVTEDEKAAAAAAAVAAWLTQTPYPTFTPVFIEIIEEETAEPGVSETALPDGENTGNQTEMVSEPIVSAELPEKPQTEERPAADPEPDKGAAAQMRAEFEKEAAEAVVKADYVDEKSGIEMIYIPAGSFLLGSDPSVDYYASLEEECPRLRIYLDGCWIGKTEVTNGQYLKCVEAGVCESGVYMSIFNHALEDYPVSYVTWDQAERFCSWIGGHLPTEYEWEKAARGTDGRIYPWGEEKPSLENDLANVPCYVDENGKGNDLFPAGSFPNGQSPYGLMDMAGNVWEWTSTWYSANYYETLAAEEELSGAVIKNPGGPENGDSRVIRGGSAAVTEVNNYISNMRCANRGSLNMNSNYYVGFRCMVPDPEPAASPAPAETSAPTLIPTKAPTPATAKTAQSTERIVVKEYLLYVTPSVEGTVVRSIQPGSKVTVLEQTKSEGRIWVRVKTEKGDTGWIPETVLEGSDNSGISSAGSGTISDEPSVGDILTFGRYEQDNDTGNGPEDIEWEVLAVQEDRVLVISKFGLDTKMYHEGDAWNVTWETCTLRKWLNGDFYANAFNSMEKRRIREVTNKNPRNSDFNTYGGADTKDRIFLLSIDEAKSYFRKDKARMCPGTAYAKAKGAWLMYQGNSWWWLRSPGKKSKTAAIIFDEGRIYSTGYAFSLSGIMVRPAFWLNL